MPGKWPDETREQALALLREGVGTNEVARRTGVAPATISGWAKDVGIASASAAQTAAANEATRLGWAQRRATLADEIGEGLPKLLTKCLDADNGSDARGFAIAFGTLLDKAQLVTGGVTSRHEQLDAQRRRGRLEEIGDDLAARRAAKDGTTGG